MDFRSSLRPLAKQLGNLYLGVSKVLILSWSASRALTLSLCAANIVLSVTPALQVWLMGYLVDRVVTNIGYSSSSSDFAGLFAFFAFSQLAIYVASGSAQATVQATQQLLQDRLTIRIQAEIMEHANTLDLATFESSAYYDRLQQAQRESTVRPMLLLSQLFQLTRSLITASTMIGLLYHLGWWLAIAGLIAPLPAILSSSKYANKTFSQTIVQTPKRRMLIYLLHILTSDQAAKDVRALGLGNFLIDRYNTTASQNHEELRNLLTKRYIALSGWSVFSGAISTGILLYVAWKAFYGYIAVSSLVVYTQAASQVQIASQGVLTALQNIHEHSLYLSSLNELLATMPSLLDTASPANEKRPRVRGLEFRSVGFMYPGREEYAVRSLSFTVAAGETVAIVGANGAGKTTIVKLLSRLYDPTEGAILLDGIDLREYEVTALRQKISVMFQDYSQFQFTVAENVGIGDIDKIYDRHAIRQALAVARADAFVDELPEGIDSRLGRWFENGHQLSGGEWQKIALARVLMRTARVRVLDEPTAALDARAEQDLFDLVRSSSQHQITIYITHRIATARAADRIIVLESGVVKEMGSHEVLLRKRGLYAELFRLQAVHYH